MVNAYFHLVISTIAFNASPHLTMPVVKVSTRQPCSAAWLYFSQSFWKQALDRAAVAQQDSDR